MTEEQTIRQACENILGFITHGNKKHVLRPEDEVLILGDNGSFGKYGYLTPLYTQTLAETIEDWQGNADRVHVKFLPDKRPFTSVDQLDPEITRLASTVPVVIGTYSNPGPEVSVKEKPTLFQGFVTPATSRKDSSLRLYTVAARTTPAVLKSLSNSEQIRNTDRLTRALKSYLEKNVGETMYVYSDGEHVIPSCLFFNIPTSGPIIGDFSEAQEYIKNIPFGEGFIEPEPGTGFGNLVMEEGSYYDLEIPIRGRIDITFSHGKIRDVKDVQGKDSEILAYLNKHLQDIANSHFAEWGGGTNLGSTEIPLKEAVYNRIIREKTVGFHIAYGGSKVFGGTHEAPVHVDNLFTYGNVYVGKEALIRNGKLREKVLHFD